MSFAAGAIVGATFLGDVCGALIRGFGAGIAFEPGTVGFAAGLVCTRRGSCGAIASQARTAEAGERRADVGTKEVGMSRPATDPDATIVAYPAND